LQTEAPKYDIALMCLLLLILRSAPL